jgi:hypothetical protein
MDRPTNTLAVFDVTSPMGEAFTAAVVRGDTYEVWSDRTGDWALEPKLQMADLFHPEQNLMDWDIYREGEGPAAASNGGGTPPPDSKKKPSTTTQTSPASQKGKPAADSGPPVEDQGEQHPSEEEKARAMLQQGLTPRMQQLLHEALSAHPSLSKEEALEQLLAAGA